MQLRCPDFYFKRHWDKLPDGWCSTLSDWTTEELSFLLDQQPVHLQKVAPLSLLSFKACCDTFSLDRRCEEDVSNKLHNLFMKTSHSTKKRTETCDQSSKTSPVKFSLLDESGKLHAFFKKHVKPKKQHEIKNLGQVIYLLCDHIKCDTVIDVGSGLGHLARVLSFGYNLNVTSVEAAGTHAPKATKYDQDIDREIKKKLQTAKEKTLEGNEVALPCHVTSMIYPNMTADEFLAIITSQEKQEIHSDPLVTNQQYMATNTGSLGKDGYNTCNTCSHTYKVDVQEIETDCANKSKEDCDTDFKTDCAEEIGSDYGSFNQCKGKVADKHTSPNTDECTLQNLPELCKDVKVKEQNSSSTGDFTRKDKSKSEKHVNETQSDCEYLNKCAGMEISSIEQVKVNVENPSMESRTAKHEESQQCKRMKYTKPDSSSRKFDHNPVNLKHCHRSSALHQSNTGTTDSDNSYDDNSQTDVISTLDLGSSSVQIDFRNKTAPENQSEKSSNMEADNSVQKLGPGLGNVSKGTETSDQHKAEHFQQMDSSKWRFVLTGLHACGDLTPTFLRFFVNCDAAVGLASVGCCYMKISDERGNDNTVGYPMSQYVASLPHHSLSYASRELACHFADTYSQRLKECPPLLKIHSYRAALEWIANHLCPNFKRTAVQIPTRKTNLQFDRYVRLGLQKLGIPEERLTDDVLNQACKMTERWKDVVAFYTIRLALAPVVETLVLLDRMIFLYEQGYVCAAVPVFDPGLSPRNFVLLSWKMKH